MSPNVAVMLTTLIPLWMSMVLLVESARAAKEIGLPTTGFRLCIGLAIAVTAIQAVVVVVDVMGWW